jgi:hypothetical protein
MDDRMLAEFLYHFFAFDLDWLLAFIFSSGHLLWLFLFGAAGFYFYANGTKQSWFWATVFVVFYVWAAVDFGSVTGWVTLGRDQLSFSMILGDNYGRERGYQENASTNARNAYQQERSNQLGALQNERNFAQSALEAERGRQYGTQENALSRATQAAGGERNLWSQLLDNQLTRGMNASEGELGRGVQVQSILPQLMQSRYQDADVLRSLGSEYRNYIDQQNQIDYQNKQQEFQWPLHLYDILGSGLANFTGGGSTTTQTGTNPNAPSGGAQAVGLGTLGVVALSQIGSWLYPGGAADIKAGG